MKTFETISERMSCALIFSPTLQKAECESGFEVACRVVNKNFQKFEKLERQDFSTNQRSYLQEHIFPKNIDKDQQVLFHPLSSLLYLSITVSDNTATAV